MLIYAKISFMLELKNIKGDIYGGITAGIIALPLALALGVASGLGAAAGLWGAVIVCIFATIFGGTPTQISGPTGPMTVVIASIALSNGNNPKLIFMTILLAGFFQIILGLLKVGKFIKYVPYPVISGFMSGIGAIIILLQLNPLIGINFDGAPVQNLLNFLVSIKNINYQSLFLGLLTLLIVFLTPKKITTKIPSPLIALIVVSLISYVMNFDVITIGNIPAAFPSFSFPSIHYKELNTVLPLALTLSLLGSIDSLLTSLVADSLTKTKHNSNRELIGQGLGNMVSALFGGLAGAGATMRTVVNIKSGGTSRLSGITHSVFLIAVVLAFSPLAAKIPMAVLAGILVKVGFDIIDYKFLKVLKIAPKGDLAVMLLVFLITVLDDLILAVGIGVVLSSVIFSIKISNEMNIKIKGLETDEDESVEDSIEEDKQNKILIMHIKGIFFFGSASHVLSRVENILDTEHIIIDCQTIKYMDISAVFALEDMAVRLQDSGAKISFIFNNKKLAVKVLKLGLDKIISKSDIFFDIESAIVRAKTSV